MNSHYGGVDPNLENFAYTFCIDIISPYTNFIMSLNSWGLENLSELDRFSFYAESVLQRI